MKVSYIVGFIVAALVIYAGVASLALWSLNTLFEAAGTGVYIPHSYNTYLATMFLSALVYGAPKGRSNGN